MLRTCLLILGISFYSAAIAELSIFDSHLHYNQTDREKLSPEQIIGTLKENNVSQAAITSRPPELVLALREQDPERIIPLLGVYRQSEDKQNWYRDTTLPARVAGQLKNHNWQGIGELHLFAEHRHSPVFRQIVHLAARHKLPLMMHADPAVIDTIHEWQPELTVIWAHAGAYPYPDLLADYLKRYPNLLIDLSVRDERIAPGGKIRDDWYELLIRYPGRFLVGVDTFSTRRWQAYRQRVTLIRNWLEQLPADIRQKLAYGNAQRLFSHDAGPNNNQSNSSL